MASQQSGACARANINGSACRTRHSASTNPWTIRVLAMAGRILVVPCGAGILTSIASIKRQVASLQPALAFWPTDHMFLLRPPALADAAVVELEHSSHAATSVIDEATGIPPERAGSEEPLADSNTLSDCGIGDGDLLHLLVRPIEWSESELAIQHRVQGCGATLDVPESGLGQRAIAAIVWAMSNEVNPDLRQINLYGNGVGDGGAAALAHTLRSPSSTISRLDLGDSRIEPAGAASLAGALRENAASALQDLCMRGNDIGDAGATSLASALGARTCQLRRLDLAATTVGDGGAIAISEALRANHQHSQLTHLILSSNAIRAEGAAALASVLGTGSAPLRVLNLAWNKFGAAGAAALCNALASNRESNLEQLILQGNAIGARGVAGVVTLLRSPASALQRLDLSFIPFGDEGAQSVAAALGTNTTLRHLDLAGCRIRADGAEALAAALGVNSTLAVLNAANNAMGARGAGALFDAVLRGMQRRADADANSSVNSNDAIPSFPSFPSVGNALMAEVGNMAASAITFVNLSDNGVDANCIESFQRRLADMNAACATSVSMRF